MCSQIQLDDEYVFLSWDAQVTLLMILLIGFNVFLHPYQMWGGITPPISWIVLAPFDYPFSSTLVYLICFFWSAVSMDRKDFLSLWGILSPLVLYHFGMLADT